MQVMKSVFVSFYPFWTTKLVDLVRKMLSWMLLQEIIPIIVLFVIVTVKKVVKYIKTPHHRCEINSMGEHKYHLFPQKWN